MNSLQSLLHLWKIVGVYYIFCFLTVWLIAWWLGLGWAIAIFLIEAFLHISWWGELKSKMLKSLPNEIQYVTTSLGEDFSNLNTDELSQYTQELEALGFIFLKDYKLASESGGNPSDFSRLFSHPQHYCFAECFQICPPGKEALPMTCTIMSYLSENWSLATTQNKPNGLTHMWRSSKNLWAYFPSAIPAELLSAHLERRQQIINVFKLTILTDICWESYVFQNQKAAINRQQRFKSKNLVIGLIEATLFELKPLSEWMGNSPKLAAKKR